MTMDSPEYDVCIIGAGVVGCAAARELSRFDLSVVVIEREDDVGCGATKANSGIVHGGYAAKYGTLKGSLCVRGNGMFPELEKELGFGYRRTGALVLAFDDAQTRILGDLAENGGRNGVSDLRILRGGQIRDLEPALSTGAVAALHCAEVGVASPYELAIALAENASANGVRFILEHEVVGIDPGRRFDVRIRNSETGRISGVSARFVVNAAGVFSDRVTAMVTDPGFRIIPRRGQYIVFERGYGDILKSVVFQTPTSDGKGVLVTPTYHRNLMVGPNADEIQDREDVGTDADTLRSVVERARRSVPDIDLRKSITTFAGVRAASTAEDFIIGPTEVPRFVQASGIDSPGLTASPAIAEMIRDALAGQGLELEPKIDFDPFRRPIIIPKDLDDQEVARLLSADPPERIVCRCERVSHGEIADAMNRGLPVRGIDAVKRRTRAGQGRCQGAYCRPRVAAILAERTGIPAEKIVERYERDLERKRRVRAALLSVKERENG